jgi:hypothetical protein
MPHALRTHCRQAQKKYSKKRKMEDVDRWVSTLLQCKPLSENDVRALCEKVTTGFRFFRESGEKSFLALLLFLVLFGCRALVLSDRFALFLYYRFSRVKSILVTMFF